MTVGGDGGDTWSQQTLENKNKLSKERKNKMMGNSYNNVNDFSVRQQISKSIREYIKNKSLERKIEESKKITEGLLRYYNSEQGKLRKEKMRENFLGQKGSMSLSSIAERNNCSLEEAKKLTPNYGKSASSYSKQRASETHKGKKLNKEQKQFLKEINLKYKYIIYNKITNETFEIINLYEWCKEKNISYGILIHRSSLEKEIRIRKKLKEWDIKRILLDK
jgi:hypothetical protein